MKHFIRNQGLMVCLGCAIGATLIVAILAAHPWPIGRPTKDAAIIWVEAFAAIGTLGAVGIALIAARDAHDALKGAEVERHKNLSSHVRLEGYWLPAGTLKNSDPRACGEVVVKVYLDGGQPAFNVKVLLKSAGMPPILLETLQGPNLRSDVHVECRANNEAFGSGSAWCLICESIDILGWRVRQQTETPVVLNEMLQVTGETGDQHHFPPLSLGQPDFPNNRGGSN